MRGGAHPIHVFGLNPANSSGRFVHLGRVDQDDSLRREAAHVCGRVLGGVTPIQDEDRVELMDEGVFGQPARNQDSGRVVGAERIANTQEGNPWQAKRLARLSSQQLVQRACPGNGRHLHLFHNRQ